MCPYVEINIQLADIHVTKFVHLVIVSCLLDLEI